MSNEELKLEAIKKAYGDAYRSYNVNENGWHVANDPKTDKPEQNGFALCDVYVLSNLMWRPNSLNGIETNNRWIRIESQEQYDELENGSYFWYNIDTGRYDSGDLWEYGVFTHYQPIIKPEIPLW
jgi:hypothetical protein